MEVLIAGAAVTVIVEIMKVVLKRIGNDKLKTPAIILSGLVVSIIAAVVLRAAPEQVIGEVTAIWVSSLAIYDVVYKMVLQPALKQLGR
jgi:hypothetical protein